MRATLSAPGGLLPGLYPLPAAPHPRSGLVSWPAADRGGHWGATRESPCSGPFWETTEVWAWQIQEHMPPCLFCRCELLLFSDSWMSAVRILSEAEITAQQHPADCGASPCLAGADPPLKPSKRRVTFKGPKTGREAGADDQVLLLSY